MFAFVFTIAYVALAAPWIVKSLELSNVTNLSAGAASKNLQFSPWPDPPYRVPVGSHYGFLNYFTYGRYGFTARFTWTVDDFMTLIIHRLGAGNFWPYAKKEFSAQLPSDENSQPFSFELAQGFSLSPIPLADDYLGTLMDVIRGQNAAHGVRELGANVEGYAPYVGSNYAQKRGPASFYRGVQRSAPVFIAVEDLIGQSIFLEVMTIGPTTYPGAYRSRYIEFLGRTLDQLRTLPPQNPFLRRRGEDTADPQGKRFFYDLQRNTTETRASSQFSYSLAVSVTEAFLFFVQDVVTLSYMHFKVVQIVDGGAPAFIGFGTFARAGTPILGGQNDSSGAADTA